MLKEPVKVSGMLPRSDAPRTIEVARAGGIPAMTLVGPVEAAVAATEAAEAELAAAN